MMKRHFYKTTITLLLKKNKDPTDKWSHRLMSLVLKKLITHLLAFASSSMFTLFAGPWGSHLIRWLRRPLTKLCGRFSLSSFRNWVLVINSAPGLDSYPYFCKCISTTSLCSPCLSWAKATCQGCTPTPTNLTLCNCCRTIEQFALKTRAHGETRTYVCCHCMQMTCYYTWLTQWYPFQRLNQSNLKACSLSGPWQVHSQGTEAVIEININTLQRHPDALTMCKLGVINNSKEE